MAKTVKFKNEAEKISMIGREVLTSDNLTLEKYEKLVKEYPDLADKFVVSEEKDSSTANNE